MKRILLAICLTLSSASWTGICAADGIKLVSANLRTMNASKKDGDNNWEHRKDAMVRMINQESPDIFGIQEGHLAQIDYISANCPGYGRVGVGRDSGASAGEHCSIYYSQSRFALLDNGDFWLSETPDKPSLGWDEKYYRIVSWAKLQEKSSGRCLVVFNTHFPLSEKAQEGAMNLLVERIRSISGGTPVAILGDWNMTFEHPLIASMLQEYRDLRTSFQHPDTRPTYNAFGQKEGKLIDHIFFRGLNAESYSLLDGDYGVPFISDHYPVEGIFTFRNESSEVAECVARGADGVLRVLAIGNSYSVDAVNQNLHELASEAGKKLIIGNLYIGGCSLQRHWKSLSENIPDYTYYKIGTDGKLMTTKNVVMNAGLDDEPWDVITLQQTSKTCGFMESYEPYLAELVNYLRSHYPGARLLWHQTWAYATNSTHESFPKFWRSQKAMYDGILQCSSAICDKYGMYVIPCGTAIQNLRGSYIGENVNRDGHHLGMTGRYTAALTWLGTLFGEDVTRLTYAPENMFPFQTEAAREAAKRGVESPYSSAPMRDFKPSDDPARKVTLSGVDVSELTKEVYGTAPDGSIVSFKPVRQKKGLLSGKADAFEVEVYYKEAEESYSKNGYNCFRMLIFVPAGKKKVPAVMCLNNRGNHCLTAEEWVHRPGKKEIAAYKVYDPQPKGCDAALWNLEDVIDSGCAFVTFYYGDVTPDYDGGASRGVQRCFPKKYTWGAIAAWAWSLSRALDYLESFPRIDAGKVTLEGEGKLGLAAEWAAKKDSRFAGVKTNLTSPDNPDSYLSHPHWYCRNYYRHSAVQ